MIIEAFRGHRGQRRHQTLHLSADVRHQWNTSTSIPSSSSSSSSSSTKSGIGLTGGADLANQGRPGLVEGQGGGGGDEEALPVRGDGQELLHQCGPQEQSVALYLAHGQLPCLSTPVRRSRRSKKLDQDTSSLELRTRRGSRVAASKRWSWTSSRRPAPSFKSHSHIHAHLEPETRVQPWPGLRTRRWADWRVCAAMSGCPSRARAARTSTRIGAQEARWTRQLPSRESDRSSRLRRTWKFDIT